MTFSLILDDHGCCSSNAQTNFTQEQFKSASRFLLPDSNLIRKTSNHSCMGNMQEQGPMNPNGAISDQRGTENNKCFPLSSPRAVLRCIYFIRLLRRFYRTEHLASHGMVNSIMHSCIGFPFFSVLLFLSFTPPA